jgi:hypothetical protein
VKSSRFVTSTLTLVALAALLTSCGTNSTPTSPGSSLDTAPPSAPVTVDQSADPLTGADILEWTASSSGNVSGYQVWAFLPNPANENAYVQVATLGSGVTSWHLPTVATRRTQYYRIRAIDSHGNHSSGSDPFNATLNPPPPGGGDTGGGDDGGHGFHE